MKFINAIQLAALFVIATNLTNPVPAFAAENADSQSILQRVGIDQRLDQQVPLELSFRDESGREIQLRDYFGGPPVILLFAYYRCPMLCTQVLNGLLESLQLLPFEMGKQFRVVTVSIDPHETTELAAAKKATYALDYGKPGAQAGWHFLTGDEAAIKRLAAAVGFRYAYDPQLDQFAHASGIVVVTPQGKIARYFFGIQYPARDLRLALLEASEGKIGTLSDSLLLLCYHYDESTGKYTPAVMSFIRLGGTLTLLVLAVFLSGAWMCDRRARRERLIAME